MSETSPAFLNFTEGDKIENKRKQLNLQLKQDYQKRKLPLKKPHYSHRKHLPPLQDYEQSPQ